MRQGCGCFGTAIGLGVFFVVGLGLAYWGWGILQNAQASANWPTTQGQITHSEIDESQDDDGTSYHADILFEYAVNDQRYTGDTVSFGQYGGSYDHAAGIVSNYPVEKSVLVYYNPEVPEAAVLEPGVTWSSYMLLGMGLCFAGVPFIFGPVALLQSFRRR